MPEVSTHNELLDQCRQSLEGYREALGRYDVEIPKELKIISDDCYICYFDYDKQAVSISLPDPSTPDGIKKWELLAKEASASSVNEMVRFTQIVIARIVAHELTHYIRKQYRTASNRIWIEEHVANRFAHAYSHDAISKDADFLQPFLERALASLDADKKRQFGSMGTFHELGQLLVNKGTITKEQLDEAVEFSKKSHMNFSEVLIHKHFITRPEWERLVNGQRASDSYVNASYVASFIENGHFHWKCLLSDLKAKDVPDLGELANKYILNENFDLRRYEESRLILHHTIISGSKVQAEAAAQLLIEDIYDTMLTKREIDDKTATKLFNELERLPENAQPQFLRALSNPLPHKMLTDYCRKIITSNAPKSLISEAMIVMFSKDKELVNKSLDKLLQSENPDENAMALDSIAKIRVPKFREVLDHYKEPVKKLLGSDDKLLRTKAWNTIRSYTPEEKEIGQELKKALADNDPAIRSSALDLIPDDDEERIKPSVNDTSDTIRKKAFVKLSSFTLEPLEILRLLGYSSHKYMAVLSEAEKAKSSPERAQTAALIDWCIKAVTRLNTLRRSLKKDIKGLQVIDRVVSEEIAGWRKIAIKHWIEINDKRDLESILKLLDHKDENVSNYAKDIFRQNISDELSKVFSDEKPDGNEENIKTTMEQLYKSSGEIFRAVIVYILKNSMTTLPEETSKAILNSASSDNSEVVKELLS